jgi:hypothetical protein
MSKMQQIYKNAQSGFVLDADLFRLEVQDSIVEVGMMLILSTWSTRLRACQEGSLNNHISLAFTDGIIDLDALIRIILAQLPDADPRQHTLRDKMLRVVMILLGRLHLLDSKADGVRGLHIRN